MSTLNGKIVQYIRNGRNQRIGVVVAIDAERVGWSVCNKKDHFDKEKAVRLAVGRAELANELKDHDLFPAQPVRMVNRTVTDGNVNYNVRVDAVAETINKVKSRAAAYFKGVTA
jgi:hypothetical protein